MAPRPSDEELAFVAVLKEDEKALMTEKAYLLSQRKFLEENLNDINTSKSQLVDASTDELRVYQRVLPL